MINQDGKFWNKPAVLILSFALVLLVRWIQILAGPEFAFSFLYLIPIVTVTWLAGMCWGITISAVSAFLWLLADLSLIAQFSKPHIPLINESLRLTVFLFIVFIIVKYKKILANEKELAAVDPLTGAANRRAFFRLAKTEIDRSSRYGHPFAVIVMDIDNFKQINDNLGHETGDRLLIKVVETIKCHLRAIDIVARFGGDEFAILLVRTDDRAALLVIRKLQKKLLEFMGKNKWPVTFSIGLATYHSVPESVEETIMAADKLMYEVKHNGKNNIRHGVMK